MLFMIWVNDFWSLTDIPKWLKHAQWNEDYMGFSDVIFPLFLFIVGLSIPLAVQHRLRKGESIGSITKHALLRSFSLIVIGVFMVNYETIHAESLMISRLTYCFIMTIGFTLIWMNWKRSPVSAKLHLPLQLIGIGILIFLTAIYKGGENGELWLTTQWWGILGLIGWAYVINVLLYILFRNSLIAMISILLVFTLLSSISATIGLQLPEPLFFLRTILGGTIPAFTAGGMLATLIVQKLSKRKPGITISILTLIGAIYIAFGLITRPIWGISKIGDTPSWMGICVGIGFILFAFFYYIADVRKKTNWANVISAAGTATLTCYMLPYLTEPIIAWVNIQLPALFYVGVVGLIKSFLYAFLIVQLARFLEAKGFKLKL